MKDLKVFETQEVRTHWDQEAEKWCFSVVDVVAVLSDSSVPKRYWSDLKKKLTNEGSQLYDNIVQLKFESSDGKRYKTDCLNTENLFRLIQSIPSPKAEPFKLWLAQIASVARKSLEAKSGKKVVSELNAKSALPKHTKNFKK